MRVSSRLFVAAVAAALCATGAQVASSAPPVPAGPQGDADPGVRPDPASASAAARVLGRAVEVTGATTETIRRWANPDGTFTDEQHAGPVRVRRDGRWEPIDTTLEVRGGRVRTRATIGDVSFSAGGSDALVSLAEDDVAMSLFVPARLPAPILHGAVATYVDVVPGVDVEMTARPSGFEQSYVVESRAAAARLFPLLRKGIGLKPVRREGRLVYVDARGEERAWVGAARMWDANGRVANVDVADVATAQGRSLRVTPDSAFLDDPATVFPVTVDPIVQIRRWVDAYIESTNTTANYGANAYLKVGLRGSTQYVSYIAFDMTPYAGKNIVDIYQYMGTVDSVTCSARTTSVYKVTTPWTPSTVTWANHPTTDLTSTGLLATQTTAGGGPTGSSCASNAWMTFHDSRLTAAYRSWNSSGGNYGMSIRASTTDSTAAKDFASGENTSWTPRINITYNSYPATVTSAVTTPSTVYTSGSTQTRYVTSTRPTLSGASADADAGTTRVDFEVWNSAGTAQVAALSSGYVTAGTAASATVPSAVLADGGSYKWRAKGNDGTDVSKSYSAWVPFVVDATAPAAVGSVASTQYPQDAWNSSGGSGTFTWTDSNTDTARYLWGLDSATPQTAVTSASATVSTMPNGWHTFSVRAVDKAGNLGPVSTYAFGAGPEITTPEQGARTQSALELESRAATGYTYVTYKYRKSSTDAFVPIPPGHVTESSTPLTAWPLQFPNPLGEDSVPPSLVWSLASTLGADGSAELQVCFGTTSTTVTLCGLTPTKVALDTHEFGASYATAKLAPGTVSLLTGNLGIDEVDAEITVAGEGLSVRRTFNSKTPASPSDGIFGDGWLSSIPTSESGDWATLADHGDSVVLTSSDGALTTFAKTSSGYEVTGNAATSELTMVAGTAGTYGPATFTMTDVDGNVTTFVPAPALTAAATTSAPNVYQVSSFEQAGSDLETTYSYSGGRVEAIVLPHATGVTCAYSTTTKSWTTVGEGCRALQVSYTSGGHVGVVTYVTTDPSAGTPLYVDVACYTYSGTKLVSAWDPRLAAAGTGNHPVTCGTPVLATTYTYDSSGRLATMTPPGQRPYQIAYDTSGRVAAVSRQHAAPWGTGTETTTVVYDIPLAPDTTYPEYRPDMRKAAVATWAQRDVPTNATAIFAPGTTASSTDVRSAAVLYMDVHGRTVNTASYSGTGAAGWHIGTSEYDDAGRPVRTLSPSNRAEALSPTTGAGAALGLPADTAAAATMVDAQSFYDEDGLLTDSFGPYHLVAVDDGAGDVMTVPAREHTHVEYDDGTEVGKPIPVVLSLEVLRTTGASLSGSPVATNEKDVRTTKTEYALSSTENEGWLLRSAMRVTTDPGSGGLALTTVKRYDPETGAPTETWTPKASDPTTPTGDVDRYKTRMTYFSAPAGTAADNVAACLKRAWVGLLCKTERVAPPGVTGLPTLPVSTFAYDYLGRATTATDTVVDGGGVTRTRVATTTFDPSPYSTRPQTMTTTGVGVAVPAVTTTYSSSTGLPVTAAAAATAELAASSMQTAYDDFGREVSFTDADGATTTTTFDGTTGRVASVQDSKGTYTFAYDGGGERRGLVTGVTASGITGSFAATYDAESRIATHTMPNGVTEAFTRNERGRAVDLVVAKSGTVWLDDAVVPSIHGQVRVHSGGGSVQKYAYDAAGRLVRTQDTAGDEGCVTRTYGYDSSTNRTASTTYPADSANACQTATGGVTATHEYDPADRLKATGSHAGLGYDAFGRVTTLPANDAGGTATTMTYYTTDLVRQQTRGSTTTTWSVDAALRFRTSTEAVSGVTTATKTNHYGSRHADGPSWIDEGVGTWTRNLTGLGGTLSATADQDGVVTYYVANLHGDLVGAASATSATPDASFSADEFGNPRDTTQRRYGWLGGHQKSLDAQAGVVLMGVRLYLPSLGRFLQPDPVVGGSCNAYEYACQDPVNLFDLDGRSLIDGSGGGESPCGSPECWCVIGILLGNYDVPRGFMDWAKRRSSRFYLVYGPRGHVGRGDGGCSGPPIFLGDTGASYNFRFSCQLHDLGYDLMRFFRSSGYRGSTRKSIDLQFHSEMKYHCSKRGIFTKPRCYFWAEAYFDVVALNSIRQGYGVP